MPGDGALASAKFSAVSWKGCARGALAGADALNLCILGATLVQAVVGVDGGPGFPDVLFVQALATSFCVADALGDRCAASMALVAA